MSLEVIIIGLVVLAAIAYMSRSIRRKFRGSCPSCSGCAPVSARKKLVERALK